MALREPLVSVVIPAYNAAGTIHATLTSVLRQSLADLEVIVIDDGSTDTTLQVLAGFQDTRLRVLSFENGGLAASRNRGILHARARFVSFLDADDIWMPDKLQSQLEALERNPDAAVAYSWTDYIDEAGRFLYQGSHSSFSGQVYAHLLEHNFVESGSNVLVRRGVFEQVGNFDARFPGAEDWDFLLRVASRYPFAVVRKPQVLYRVVSGSMSSNIARQESALLGVIQRNFTGAPAQIQTLRRRTLSNIYSYLALRAIDSSTDRRRSRVALQCLGRAIASDSSLLLRKPAVLAIATGKIALTALLPRGSATILSAVRRFTRRRAVPAHP